MTEQRAEPKSLKTQEHIQQELPLRLQSLNKAASAGATDAAQILHAQLTQL